MITPQEVKEIVPIINDDPNCRYPILGAYYQPRGGTGVTMRLPGVTPAAPTRWASTSSRTARSSASTATAAG